MDSFPCMFCESAFDEDDTLRRHLDEHHPVEMASESFHDGSTDIRHDECDDEMMNNLLCGNFVQVNMVKDDEIEPSGKSANFTSVPTPEQGLEVLRNIPSLSISLVSKKDKKREAKKVHKSVPLSITVKPSRKEKARIAPKSLPEYLLEVCPPPGKRLYCGKPLKATQSEKDNATEPSAEFVKSMMSVIAPRVQHAPRTTFVCALCSKSFNDTRSLHGHHIKHLSDNLLCFACHRTFVTNQDFMEHTQSHEEEETAGVYFPRPCFICSQNIRKHEELVAHVKNHRPMFICPHCDQKYARKRDLNIHVFDKPLKCHVCEALLPCQGLYKPHWKTHTLKFDCNICRKGFVSKSEFDLHNHEFHGEINPESYISCPMCHKNFKEILTLQAHLDTCEKSDTCPMCHMKFTQTAMLQVHLANCEKLNQEGNPARNWVCGVCNKRFSTDRYLKIHLKVHGISERVTCEKCNNMFHSQEALNEHWSKMHGDSPFLRCPICNTVVENRKKLQEHMQQHTGENMFKCTSCDKAFGQKRLLVSHRKVHTESMSFECDECGMVFKGKGTKNRHMKVVHPDCPSTSYGSEDTDETDDDCMKVDMEIMDGISTSPDLQPDTLLIFKSNNNEAEVS
ncbi:gastrula zinc finger protein XlCGF26.1-like [Artemia franciscana]|uniref:C2H2-type domain-containing protein n=1 Tax=Artemia franciscana TaxID=6661 RepID=A0AA88LB36_ARTSF|nr:hypothetical protein QYM36_002265 [Artemia franciscana]KAK2723853.1 hypothetical protein QYM36_002265 [Artemia franciscana]